MTDTSTTTAAEHEQECQALEIGKEFRTHPPIHPLMAWIHNAIKEHGKYLKPMNLHQMIRTKPQHVTSQCLTMPPRNGQANILTITGKPIANAKNDLHADQDLIVSSYPIDLKQYAFENGLTCEDICHYKTAVDCACITPFELRDHSLLYEIKNLNFIYSDQKFVQTIGGSVDLIQFDLFNKEILHIPQSSIEYNFMLEPNANSENILLHPLKSETQRHSVFNLQLNMPPNNDLNIKMTVNALQNNHYLHAQSCVYDAMQFECSFGAVAGLYHHVNIENHGEFPQNVTLSLSRTDWTKDMEASNPLNQFGEGEVVMVYERKQEWKTFAQMHPCLTVALYMAVILLLGTATWCIKRTMKKLKIRQRHKVELLRRHSLCHASEEFEADHEDENEEDIIYQLL